MLLSRLALALLAAALLAGMMISGCGVTFGDGPSRTETRTVAPFHRVEVHGSANVVVRPGRTRSVVVRGGEKLVRKLRTRVEGDALVVDREGRGTLTLGDGHLWVTVTTPGLRAAAVDGSGDLDLEGLAAPAFEAHVDGSGDLRGSGRIGDLSATVDGSGDLDLRDAPAQRATVAVAGSADAFIHAVDWLDASVAGSGDLSYSGAARVRRSKVTGSGDFQRVTTWESRDAD